MSLIVLGTRHRFCLSLHACRRMLTLREALSPARFYHLPPNRVVELGTQVSI